MAEPPREFFGIFGAGRSGTTVLMQVLDGSPDVWMHPVETNYLGVWDDLVRLGKQSWPTMQNATTKPLTALDEPLPASVLLDEFGYQWHWLEEKVLPLLSEPVQRAGDPGAELRGRESYQASEFLPALIEATRSAYGGADHPARALGFKTLETPYVEDYARVFSELRFVHIVRDPVANYASLKRTNVFRKGQSFYGGGFDQLRMFLEARWLPHARVAPRLARREPERHLLVRYEDLTAEPQRVIGEICAWLGVEAPADREQLTALGGRRMAPRELSSQPGVGAQPRVVANLAERFDYVEVVSDRERALIRRCTEAYARPLGYGTDEDGRVPGLRLWLQWLPPDSWERMNLRSRARWLWEIAKRRAYVTRKLAATRAP